MRQEIWQWQKCLQWMCGSIILSKVIKYTLYMAIYKFYVNLKIHIYIHMYIYTHTCTYISKVEVKTAHLDCIIFALIELFSLNCFIILCFVIKSPQNIVKSSFTSTAVFSGGMLEWVDYHVIWYSFWGKTREISVICELLDYNVFVFTLNHIKDHVSLSQVTCTKLRALKAMGFTACNLYNNTPIQFSLFFSLSLNSPVLALIYYCRRNTES